MESCCHLFLCVFLSSFSGVHDCPDAGTNWRGSWDQECQYGQKQVIRLVFFLYAHITDFAVTWWRCSFGVKLGATGSTDCELALGHSVVPGTVKVGL